MAETLGMLCDKLTIVKLKQYNTEDKERLASLEKRSFQLQEEINEYITFAVQDKIPAERMSFDANKVFKTKGNAVEEMSRGFREVMYQLADVNCRLWISGKSI
ncbi:MAG: hypothetical protein ABL876_05360 [Chitinophagaceae bacterium]